MSDKLILNAKWDRIPKNQYVYLLLCNIPKGCG